MVHGQMIFGFFCFGFGTAVWGNAHEEHQNQKPSFWFWCLVALCGPAISIISCTSSLLAIDLYAFTKNIRHAAVSNFLNTSSPMKEVNHKFRLIAANTFSNSTFFY